MGLVEELWERASAKSVAVFTLGAFTAYSLYLTGQLLYGNLKLRKLGARAPQIPVKLPFSESTELRSPTRRNFAREQRKVNANLV